MSQEERTGERNLAFSRWHREHSIARFVGPIVAPLMHYVDIDCAPVCHRCKEPLAVIETARDTGRFKPASVTKRMAQRLGVPGLVVLYTETADGDISGFRVERLGVSRDLETWTPQQYVDWEVALRAQHRGSCPLFRKSS